MAGVKTDTLKAGAEISPESRSCMWNPEHRRGVLGWQQGHSLMGSSREGRGISWDRFGEERVSVTIFFLTVPSSWR